MTNWVGRRAALQILHPPMLRPGEGDEIWHSMVSGSGDEGLFVVSPSNMEWDPPDLRGALTLPVMRKKVHMIRTIPPFSDAAHHSGGSRGERRRPGMGACPTHPRMAYQVRGAARASIAFPQRLRLLFSPAAVAAFLAQYKKAGYRRPPLALRAWWLRADRSPAEDRHRGCDGRGPSNRRR